VEFFAVNVDIVGVVNGIADTGLECLHDPVSENIQVTTCICA